MMIQRLLRYLTDMRLRLLLEKAENYLGMTNQSFSFGYGKSRYSLKFDEILYFEKKGRQALIHTADNIYKTNMTTKEIWESIDEGMFATIHGSFIVNLKHVKTVSSGGVRMFNGQELAVTRRYRKSLAEKHMEFVQGGMLHGAVRNPFCNKHI